MPGNTHTKSTYVCARVSGVVRGKGDMVTSGQPTHEPSTYIYVLKGIQEYILHMLYCRLISNSAAMALEERHAVGEYERIPSPLWKAVLN